jgi:hypothetical protein
VTGLREIHLIDASLPVLDSASLADGRRRAR